MEVMAPLQIVTSFEIVIGVEAPTVAVTSTRGLEHIFVPFKVNIGRFVWVAVAVVVPHKTLGN